MYAYLSTLNSGVGVVGGGKGEGAVGVTDCLATWGPAISSIVGAGPGGGLGAWGAGHYSLPLSVLGGKGVGRCSMCYRPRDSIVSPVALMAPLCLLLNQTIPVLLYTIQAFSLVSTPARF